MNEVHTLWLFIPGGIFLAWGIVLSAVTAISSKGLKMMRPQSSEFDPKFENTKNILRWAAYAIGAGANRFILFGTTLICLGMAFS